MNGYFSLRAIATSLLLAASWPAAPSGAAESFERPPQVLADLVEAPPTPEVELSPDREWLLLTESPSLLDLAELAQEELRLAGLRILPSTNGRSRTRPVHELTLMRRSSLEQRPVEGLPAGARIDHVRWSPDSRHVAFSITGSRDIAPWVLDVATARARPLAALRLNGAGTDPLRWLPDGKGLLCATVPPDRPAAPVAAAVPAGPVIQESTGKAAPARTYQDLLQTPHDEQLFEHYLLAQIVRVDLDGATRPLGQPGLLWALAPSPDGRYLHVEMLHRPFSYLVPASRFPRTVEIWDRDGTRVRLVADLPLQEQVPIAFDGVPTGPRSAGWRDDRPATMTWVEARDGGDPRADAAIRDELLALEAPFGGSPAAVARFELRYSGVNWGTGDVALVTERWWRDRRTRTWVVAPDAKDRAPRLLWDRSWQDSYGDPGRPVMVPSPSGGRVLLTLEDRWLFLIGEGASPEGNRPFFDRLELASGKTERLWRSEAPYYENPVAPLDMARGLFLTRRESKDQPPNYFARDLAAGTSRQLTDFPNPTPQLAGLQKQLITYGRADGVKLSATLYLPPGYKPADGRLPMLVWAYPQEFKSADDAGQVTDSPHRFDRVGWGSPLLFLARGYAVLDDPTMPIVGEGEAEPNDTYVQQLVASAQAAIDTVVGMGIADPRRIAVGGHSYGAFMTANLLAHTDLFAAGIARSGAYNRTLTPFGFQAEERTLWEAPEVYVTMSPFMHAGRVNEPILLIHGEADNNSGTFPIQSERFYHALKGLGATTRLVMLPLESHGYRARESVLHMLWEMDRWLEIHVRSRDVEATAGVGS